MSSHTLPSALQKNHWLLVVRVTHSAAWEIFNCGLFVTLNTQTSKVIQWMNQLFFHVEVMFILLPTVVSCYCIILIFKLKLCLSLVFSKVWLWQVHVSSYKCYVPLIVNMMRFHWLLQVKHISTKVTLHTTVHQCQTQNQDTASGGFIHFITDDWNN